MKPNNDKLIASIAVFAELCDSSNDIQNIIAEFIKSSFAFEKKWSLDSYEAKGLLKTHFDFDLPEAVVRTTLNSLRNSGFLDRVNGKYVVKDTNYNAADLSGKLDTKKREQKDIENELVAYYEQLSVTSVDDKQRKEILDGFTAYIFDNSAADELTALISAFILSKSKDAAFVASINQIKEGLILLNGLSYTDDITTIDRWGDELVIYLDTEHLFNAAGFNGDVYRQLFEDFYNLIKEINSISQQKNKKKLIHLKYFKVTKEEVDRFFNVAVKIINREENASPENIAMEEICKGCSSVSDVIRKKSRFESDLKSMGISEQDELDYYSRPEFNVEDATLFEKYKHDFDEDIIASSLRLFTKINFLRRGVNRTQFENCKHITLTGRTASLILSKDLEIKSQAKDIPFVTDIYFITNRFWFKLNKGLRKSQKLPLTLDIVTKAQIALSSQVNRSIDKRYDELRRDLSNGKITEHQAQDFYYNLREKAKKPEEISQGNAKESLNFIFDDDLDKYLREKSALELKVKEGEKAILQLHLLSIQKARSKKRQHKILPRIIYFTSILLLSVVLIGVPILLWKAILNFRTEGDTPIAIGGLIFAIVLEIFGLAKWIKPLRRFLKRMVADIYLRQIVDIR